MTVGSRPAWPFRFAELSMVDRPPVDDELASLQRVRAEGLPVATIVVVPAEIEERFYRWNTLPARILELFGHVDPADPDEDDLEVLAPEAQAMIEQHYLLDEFVDAFYDRIEGLPGRVQVRRPFAEGLTAIRGRPALLAIKRLWAGDWSFEALEARLARTARFAIEARPILVHGADQPAPQALLADVRRALGASANAWVTDDGRITRIAYGDQSVDAHPGDRT